MTFRKIIIPPEVYETSKTLIKNTVVQNAITQNFSVLSNDSSIESFGIIRQVDSQEFLIKIPREEFPQYQVAIPIELNEKSRIQDYDDVELRLLKVILEKGNRKWEFVWNGIKISAPVLDDDFWEKLRQRKIQIAQGDSVIAKLRAYQILDPYSLAYFNERYEVIEIKDYKKSMRETLELFKPN